VPLDELTVAVSANGLVVPVVVERDVEPTTWKHSSSTEVEEDPLKLPDGV